MKKVWVLEKLETVEEMRETINRLADMAEAGDEMADELFTRLMKDLLDNPNGKWHGYCGKLNYKDFCWDAKDTIRRAEKGTKFRVVKAEIENDAKYWTNYVNAVENEGVLKYLYATLYA